MNQVFEIDNDALAAIPPREHERLQREAHGTAQGIHVLSSGLLPLPLHIGYDFNTAHPLVAVTCDLPAHRTSFKPVLAVALRRARSAGSSLGLQSRGTNLDAHVRHPGTGLCHGRGLDEHPFAGTKNAVVGEVCLSKWSEVRAHKLDDHHGQRHAGRSSITSASEPMVRSGLLRLHRRTGPQGSKGEVMSIDKHFLCERGNPQSQTGGSPLFEVQVAVGVPRSAPLGHPPGRLLRKRLDRRAVRLRRMRTTPGWFYLEVWRDRDFYGDGYRPEARIVPPVDEQDTRFHNFVDGPSTIGIMPHGLWTNGDLIKGNPYRSTRENLEKQMRNDLQNMKAILDRAEIGYE